MKKIAALLVLFAIGVFTAMFASASGSAAQRCTTVISTIGTTTQTVISTVTQTVTVGTTTTPPADTPGTLILSTGFENNMTMDAPDSTLTQQQYWHGTDLTTGYNMDTTQLWSDPFGLRNQKYAGSSLPVGHGGNEYVRSDIANVVGPHGSNTNVMKLGMPGDNPQADSAWQQGIIGSTPEGDPVTTPAYNSPGAVTDYYTRYWARLDPNVLTQSALAGEQTQWWRMFWESKNWYYFRVNISIMRHAYPSPPHWIVRADQGGGRRPIAEGGNDMTIWDEDLTGTVVPLDQWFYVEIYFKKRPLAADSRFAFAVNGTVILDRAGPMYGPTLDDVQNISHHIIYSHYPAPTWTYVDDLQIYNGGTPTGAFPSGPPEHTVYRTSYDKSTQFDEAVWGPSLASVGFTP